MTDLHRFFWPESIALVGVSDDPKTIRGRVLDFLLAHGYPGTIYPVSRTRAVVQGLKAYASVTDVVGPIDLAILSVQADQLPGAIEECVRKRVGFVFCFTSGFAEAGPEGKARQDELVRLARDGAVRLAGPNSAGLFNALGRVPATFTRTTDAAHLATFARPCAGPIGFVAQSGGLGFAMQQRILAEHGVGSSYVVSTGNEADLECCDFAEYMVRDEHTRVLVLIVEGFKDGARLCALARIAAELRKPILVAKFGATVAGQRAASSHSARVTGVDAVYDAVFRRHGLTRAYDEAELADFAAAFARYPLARGRRVAILTTSGGAGVWMADACERAGLSVPMLDAATQERMRAFMPSYGAAANPIDLTAQTSLNPLHHGQSKSTLMGAIEALDASDAIDAIIVVANLSDGDVLGRERAGLISAVPRLGKPLVFFSHATASRASLELLWDAGLCCFDSSWRTARAILALADYAQHLSESAKPQEPPIRLPVPDVPPRVMCEYEAKQCLALAGLPFAPERLARDEAEAAAAAGTLGLPVALKIQSPDVPHKSEVGGVLLSVTSEQAVRDGYRMLIERVQRERPQAAIHGVLVQPMLAPGIEMMVGVVHDATFGPMLIVGFGGVLVEVLHDTVIEPVPVDRTRARTMLTRLRAWPVLEGIRGSPPADVDALIDLLVALSSYAQAAGARVAEIDLNPVFVYPRGGGVAIADALLIGRAADLS